MKKRWIPALGFVLAALLAVTPAFGEGRMFSALTDSEGNLYDLFEVQKLVMDENHHVTAVMGQYERVAVNEDGEDTAVMAEDKLAHTYVLAGDVEIKVPSDEMDPWSDLVRVDDLYQWYVDTYMNGQGPESGELTYAIDLEDPFLGDPDFWLLTMKITLNDEGEVCFMQYEYTPWN